jgi:hypothetical protein
MVIVVLVECVSRPKKCPSLGFLVEAQPILYQKLFCSFQLKKKLSGQVRSESENENGSNAIQGVFEVETFLVTRGTIHYF